jgi:hypothetical protein
MRSCQCFVNVAASVHTHETLEIQGSNRCANTLEFCALTVHFHQSLGVIIHMNTKMILAAVALSLSLAACAKKEEPAEAAQDAAATANEAAGQAQDAAGDAAAAAGDAAAAAGDAAATAPAETPPADQPATPPQQ